MSIPTNQIEWLLDIYGHDDKKHAPKDVEKINLSQLISKLGFFYEKFRNAIDYNEEHLVRRNSLERFLRRHILFLQEKRPQKISESLINEFIRARYLPNDTLPETVINEIAATLEKYLIIISYVNGHKLNSAGQLTDWLISIGSCEIDEQLIPVEKEMAMVNFMYSHLVDNLTFLKTSIEEKEKNLQIYIATMRAFLKADPATLRYRLLKLYLPNWNRLDQGGIGEFLGNIDIIKNKIEAHLRHPIGFQLAHTARRQSVFFTILKEVMQKNQEQLPEIFNDQEKLAKTVEEVCLTNYHRIRGRLIGSIFRVIIYIFFTKTILAFILELPYDYFIIQKINWRALGINVAFHPLLMFFVAITIRVPGAKNTQIIIQEIKKIVYGEERKILFKAKKLMKIGSVSYIIFNTLYAIMFAISFGIVVSALKILHFNILSGILFIFFLTIVSFFGFRLRNYAKQLSVIPRKDNFLNFVADFLSLPIIRVGQFFSTNFSKINIFLFILDFIIETPFKMLVEFLEKAVSFIREKREEIE